MVQGLVPSFAKQQFRMAVESQYGVLPGSPAWRTLKDTKAVPKPQLEFDLFTAAGDSVASLQVLNDDYTNLDVSGRFSYSGIIYILSSLFGAPTITLISGGTYRYVWTWNGTDEVYPVSYAVDYGDTRTARRILGCIFNGLTIGTARSGMDFSSTMFGKDIQTGIQLGGTVNEVQTVTITGTPTGGTWTFSFGGITVPAIPYNVSASALQTLLDAAYGTGVIVAAGGPLPGTGITLTFTGRYGGRDVPLATFTHALTGGTSPTPVITATTPGADNATIVPAVPVFPLHGDVYLDNSWTAMLAETTKLLAIYNANIGIGDRYARTMPINSLRTSDALVETEDQSHTIGLQFGADATADAMLATARAGSMKFLRLKYVGGLTGDAANKYTVLLDSAILLNGTDGYDTSNGVHVATWNGAIAKDPVSGNAFRAEVICKQASL